MIQAARLLCDVTLPYSSAARSLPLQQSVPYYKQQLKRDILIERRCSRWAVIYNAYIIYKTWKYLWLMLIPANISNILKSSSQKKAYKGSQMYFISTDFPDCPSLLNILLSDSLTWALWRLKSMVEMKEKLKGVTGFTRRPLDLTSLLFIQQITQTFPHLVVDLLTSLTYPTFCF